MKTIFVTVAEFLENGGELKWGRQIYDSNDLTGYEKAFVWDDNISLSNDGKNNCSVEIECKPIYK